MRVSERECERESVFFLLRWSLCFVNASLVLLTGSCSIPSPTMTGLLDCDTLLELLREWQGGDIGNAERASFFRDMELLWDIAPAVPSTIGHQGAEIVIEHHATLKAFLKHQILSLKQRFQSQVVARTQEPCLRDRKGGLLM